MTPFATGPRQAPTGPPQFDPTNRAGQYLKEPALLVVALFVAFLLTGTLLLNVVRTVGGLKGDEATYVAMALSVAYDADLSYTHQDLTRFYEVYGSGPEGIFLKPGQGWAAEDGRLYFGKSFVYGLVAAPFARIAGLNGLLAFNVLLLAGIFACSYLFSRERLGHTNGLIVSSAFLLASVTPVYAVFLTSDLLMVALIFFAYFVWLYKEVVATETLLPRTMRGHPSDLLAATLIGVATFAKLSNLPLITPIVALAWWRGRFRDGVMTGAGCILVTLACYGANGALTGEMNYQGGLERKTFYGRFPFEEPASSFDTLGISVVTNEIMFDEAGESQIQQFARNSLYFTLGRHFGLVPYFFPGIAILLWAAAHHRDLDAWQGLIAGTLALSAAGLLFLLPNTWSGGGGPLGNRYFLPFYPAFFFLLPTSYARLPGVICFMGGTLFTAQILVNPFIAASRPWIVAERGPLRALPVELTTVNDLPVRLDAGRSRIPFGADPQLLLYYLDTNAARPEPPGIWIRGQSRADIIVRVAPPIDTLTLSLSSPIDNHVTVDVDGTTQSVNVPAGEHSTVNFPLKGVLARGAQNFLISLTVRDGFIPVLQESSSTDTRFLGVAVQMTGHAADNVR